MRQIEVKSNQDLFNLKTKNGVTCPFQSEYGCSRNCAWYIESTTPTRTIGYCKGHPIGEIVAVTESPKKQQEKK